MQLLLPTSHAGDNSLLPNVPSRMGGELSLSLSTVYTYFCVTGLGLGTGLELGQLVLVVNGVVLRSWVYGLVPITRGRRHGLAWTRPPYYFQRVFLGLTQIW